MPFDRVEIITKQLTKWLEDPINNIIFDIQKFKSTYTSTPNDSIYLNFCMVGPVDTLWYEKIYGGKMEFDIRFPMSPPKVYIYGNICHPNIYKDTGLVCISILHEGIDLTGSEKECERWSPILNIGIIMRSIFTLFHEPNCSSPANVESAYLWINDKKQLRSIIENG